MNRTPRPNERGVGVKGGKGGNIAGPKASEFPVFARLSDVEVPPVQRALGPWTVDAKRLLLRHRDAPWYEIDLREMATSEGMLDWIFHVTRKTWVSHEDAGLLLELLDRVLNPCGGDLPRKLRQLRRRS